MIEKKNPFSEEKFKPAREICISNKEPNANHQDNAENVSRACERPSQQTFPSQARRPRRKKWFCGLGLGPPFSVQPASLVPFIPVTLAMAKKGKGTVQAMASEGASSKPWQLPCGIEPGGAQKSRTEVWEPLPRFQRMCRNTWMSRQMFGAGVGPS